MIPRARRSSSMLRIKGREESEVKGNEMRSALEEEEGIRFELLLLLLLMLFLVE